MTPSKIIESNNEKLSWLHPDVQKRAVNALVDLANTYGILMKVTESLRSSERQEILFAQGRTKPGKIVTWSPPGTSWHEYGLAFDCCFAGFVPAHRDFLAERSEDWALIYTAHLNGSDPYLEKLREADFIRFLNLWNMYGAAIKKHGMVWGGQWDKKIDMPHAQQTYGLKIPQLAVAKSHGGLAAVFEIVDERAALWSNSDSSVHLN